MTFHTRNLPTDASSGRLRPSRPTRVSDRGPPSVERARTPATVRADKPVTEAITRSDQSGWVATMRSAAAPPLREGERQAVRGVRPDREHERVPLAALEEPHVDVPCAAQPGGVQAVGAVDHAHRRAVHDDRRQRRLAFREESHVLRIRRFGAW
ncbi:hypothetical protein GCM10018963_70010 [Saccharothrix longispora]